MAEEPVLYGHGFELISREDEVMGEDMAVIIRVSKGRIDGAMRVKTILYVRGKGIAFNFSYIALNTEVFDEMQEMADYSLGAL